ncbi:sugar ABC transporter permease [Streptomyces sp. NPDC020883]|uniref:sugar ABC transporter permease n=1 Tax=Streptomyces sp. NPDC020883 TaxID=3365099 RepID=UPI00378ADA2C
MPWARDALALVLDRVAVTAAEVGKRFPLYADPESGRWTTTSRGSWTGGFWAALRWLRALHSGDVRDQAGAAGCTGRLAGWLDADTAARGLIFWYGTALGAGPGGDPGAADLRDRAARVCLDAFDAVLGIVPWGAAFGGPRLVARVDGVAGMVPLLATAGTAEGRRAARSHLDRHLALCFGTEPLRPVWERTAAGRWVDCPRPAPGWSRGRAWLLLAVADAAVCLADGSYAQVAREVLGRNGGMAGGLVPFAKVVPHQLPVFDDGLTSHGPVDTSAAAIEAVALLKLATTVGASEAEGLRGRATTTLEHLVTTHLTPPGAGRPPGMLLHGCYDLDQGVAVRHELVWGDFFLALGLALVTGLVSADDV